MDDLTECCDATRKEKHLELDDAINGIDEAIDAAQSLLDRICLADQCPDPTPPRPERSLQQVLDVGADDIQQKTIKLKGIIQEMRTQLF